MKQMGDGLQIPRHYLAAAELNRKAKYKATFTYLAYF